MPYSVCVVSIAVAIMIASANAVAAVVDDADPPRTTESLRPPPVRSETSVLGDQPRAPLRLRPSVGDRQRIELVVEHLHNRMDENGTHPIERPLPLRSRLVSEVVAIDDRGNAAVTIVVESSIAQPGRLHTIDEVEGVRIAARALEGVRIELQVSELGRLVSLSFEMPRVDDEGHADVVRRQALRLVHGIVRLLNPLPEEPVGTGARWRTVSPERFRDLDRTETANFSLDRFDAGVLDISRRTHVIAPSGPGDAELIPGAISVEMVHHSGFGQGTASRRLNEVFPRSLRDEVISTSRTTGRIAGERINVHDQVFVRVDARAETIHPSDDADRPRRVIGE